MSRYQRSIITAYYDDNDTLYKLVELQLSLIHDMLQLSLIPFLARHGSHRHVAGVPFREQQQQHKLWRRRVRCWSDVHLASRSLHPGDRVLAQGGRVDMDSSDIGQQKMEWPSPYDPLVPAACQGGRLQSEVAGLHRDIQGSRRPITLVQGWVIMGRDKAKYQGIRAGWDTQDGG